MSGARPNAVPTALKVEPTSRCNLRCSFCYGRHVSQGTMDLDRLRRVLDHADGVSEIELVGEGEPMLVPDIVAMVRECRSRGIRVATTTNGSRAIHGRLREVVAAGVDQVAVSLESVRALRYAELRVGGSLDDIVEALAIIRAGGPRTAAPRTHLWVTVLRSEVPHLPLVERFAVDHGVDVVELQPLNPMKSYRSHYPDQLEGEQLTALEVEAVSRQRDWSRALREGFDQLIAELRTERCSVYERSLMVEWTGAVTPCCMIKADDAGSIGNLASQSMGEVLEGAPLKAFDRAHRTGRLPGPCEGCAFTAAGR